MKKEYSGTEWSDNRFARFQIGLALALVFVLFAFNYESERPVYRDIEVSIQEDFIEQLKSVTINTPIRRREISVSDNLSMEVEDYPLPDQDFEPISLDLPNLEVDATLTNTYVKERAAQLPLAMEDPIVMDEIIPSAPLLFAEKMPLFESCLSVYKEYDEQLECTTKQILKIIRKHLKYPRIAVENGIEGTVVGSFIVDTEGMISGIKVERTTGFGLDEAVIEVFQKIPQMIPAEQHKRKVKVKMNIPVRFKLSN